MKIIQENKSILIFEEYTNFYPGSKNHYFMYLLVTFLIVTDVYILIYIYKPFDLIDTLWGYIIISTMSLYIFAKRAVKITIDKGSDLVKIETEGILAKQVPLYGDTLLLELPLKDIRSVEYKPNIYSNPYFHTYEQRTSKLFFLLSGNKKATFSFFHFWQFNSAQSIADRIGEYLNVSVSRVE